jgi:hypothetical protein
MEQRAFGIPVAIKRGSLTSKKTDSILAGNGRDFVTFLTNLPAP